MNQAKYVCSECSEVIANNEGSIYVLQSGIRYATRKSLEMLEQNEAIAEDQVFAYTNGISLPWHVTTAADMELAKDSKTTWITSHYGCMTQKELDDIAYWFDVSKARSVSDLLSWSIHLSKRVWLDCTDWFRFIKRQQTIIGWKES